MAIRRPALVLLLLGATLAATLALLPAMSGDQDGGARASLRAAAEPYGRLVIQQAGIDARISAHSIGVNNTQGGKPNLGPISAVKVIDAGTATLFEDITMGVHLPEVVVRVFKPNGSDRIVYTLEDAIVTDFQHGGGSSETVLFAYDKITIEAAGRSFCYDVALAKAC